MFGKVILAACLLAVAVATQREIPLGERSAWALQRTAEKFEKLDDGARLASVNEMADIVLSEVRQLMGDMGLDPLRLPDVHKNFSYKPIVITYYGEIDMVRGWAQDVSEIYRNGDVKMDYTGRIITVNVPIMFKQTLFTYDYSATLMGLGPNGGVEGSCVNVQVFFSLALDFDNLVVTLNKYEITRIGKISVKFTGNGLIDWLVNFLTPIVTTIFKGLITFIAENVVRNTLNQFIEMVNNHLVNFQPPTKMPQYLLN